MVLGQSSYLKVCYGQMPNHIQTLLIYMTCFSVKIHNLAYLKSFYRDYRTCMTEKPLYLSASSANALLCVRVLVKVLKLASFRSFMMITCATEITLSFFLSFGRLVGWVHVVRTNWQKPTYSIFDLTWVPTYAFWIMNSTFHNSWDVCLNHWAIGDLAKGSSVSLIVCFPCQDLLNWQPDIIHCRGIHKAIALGKKTIHKVTTMLATSKNVLFTGYNHLLKSVGSLAPVVTWWTVVLCSDVFAVW